MSTLTWLGVPGDERAWRSLGFVVDDGGIHRGQGPDLDATVAQIRLCGGPVSDPKPAVQGGRIASVWSGHLHWGLAIMGG